MQEVHRIRLHDSSSIICKSASKYRRLYQPPLITVITIHNVMRTVSLLFPCTIQPTTLATAVAKWESSSEMKKTECGYTTWGLIVVQDWGWVLRHPLEKSWLPECVTLLRRTEVKQRQQHLCSTARYPYKAVCWIILHLTRTTRMIIVVANVDSS